MLTNMGLFRMLIRLDKVHIPLILDIQLQVPPLVVVVVFVE